MEHYYQNIQGWFNYEWIYKQLVAQAPEGAKFVEIGSWKGKSSSYLTVEKINSGKNISITCIDTWLGSSEHQEGAECEDQAIIDGTLYQQFIRNMKPVEGHYTHLRMDSVDASELFEDNSIHFLMIDAAHETELVIQDIEAWLPKMINGGLMAGDDCWVGAGPRIAAEKALAKYNVTFPNNHFIAYINR